MGTAPVLLACVPLILTAFAYAVGPASLAAAPGFASAFLALALACNALTALLLLTQYLSKGQARFLALGAGYLWALGMAGVYAVGGTAGAPTTWALWHTVFPALIGGALAPWPVRWATVHPPEVRVRGIRAVGVAMTVATLAWLALARAGVSLLPLGSTDDAARALASGWGAVLLLIALTGFGVGLVGVLQRRDHPGLESWALVALVTSVCTVLLAPLARERYTLGWYGARAMALVGAAVLLGALLRQITGVYRHLAANAAELSAQREELLAANAVREGVVAVVSHEMRTPLAALIGYLELLVESPETLSVEKQRRILGRCAILSRRSILLAEDLLAVATVSSGQMLSVASGEVVLADQLRDVAEVFPGLKVVVECPDDVIVLADHLRLQQILCNLVGNAEKYGAEPVLVKVVPRGGAVHIAVQDSGEGVPADFVPTLFDKFTRADSSVGVPGTGLGLAVARELADLQGGSLDYDAAGHAFVLTLRRPGFWGGPVVVEQPGDQARLVARTSPVSRPRAMAAATPFSTRGTRGV